MTLRHNQPLNQAYTLHMKKNINQKPGYCELEIHSASFESTYSAAPDTPFCGRNVVSA